MCRQNNIALEAYTPLARHSDKLTKNQTMIELSQKYNRTIAQISLRWGLQHGFIILPKSKTESRIKENINIYDF
jgi:diketogulonate reductase-like aldo/keto reductase